MAYMMAEHVMMMMMIIDCENLVNKKQIESITEIDGQ